MLQTISRKSLALSLGIAALIAVCCSVGAWITVDLSSALSKSARSTKILQTHMDADMMHDALRADVLAAATARDPAFGISLEDVRKDLAEHATQFRKDIAANEAAADTAGQKAVLQSLKADLDAYIGGAEHMLDLIDRKPVAAAQAMPEFLKQFEALEGGMAGASQQFEAEQNADTDQGRRHGSLAQSLMFGLLGFGIGVAGLLTWLVRASLVQPLVRMTHAIQQLAAGNVAVPLEFGRRQDEIGMMGAALLVLKQGVAERRRLADEAAHMHQTNQLELKRVEDAFRLAAQEQTRVVDCLGGALSALADGDLTTRVPGHVSAEYERLKQDFNRAIDSLQQALQTVATTVGGIRAGAGEIGQAGDDLSRRTEQQAASLEQTAAALDEITATVRKTSDGASHARQVVGAAKIDAERSGQVVREAVGAMGSIETSSGQITQIIGVIDEIAFQTNLLALNAGVEAARAGEAGRGFAVVASEVRALAQRSADAAKEIKALISSSSAQVQQGVDLVGRTGEALQRIIKQVAEIDGIVNEIAASAQEQATALNEVNTAVNQMDQVTQQNAAMVEQSSAASHTLIRETEELSGLIAKFQIGQSAMAASQRRQPPRARTASKAA